VYNADKRPLALSSPRYKYSCRVYIDIVNTELGHVNVLYYYAYIYIYGGDGNNNNNNNNRAVNPFRLYCTVVAGRPQQRRNDMQMHLPPPVQLPHRWARMLRPLHCCTYYYAPPFRNALCTRLATFLQLRTRLDLFFIFIIIRYTSYLHTHTHTHTREHILSSYINVSRSRV